VDIDTKCRALLLCRMHLRSRRVGTATASWFQTWNLTGPHTNSPHLTRIPNTLAYMYICAIDMAYINPPGKEEESKAFRRRLYITLYAMTVAAKGARETRVMHLKPSTDWPKVWHNLHTAWIIDEMKSVWFTVIHDILQTNERLVKIRLTDTIHCNLCGRRDTIQHLIMECRERADIWLWTRTRISQILRIDPRYIPPDWTIHPQFHFCSPPPLSGMGPSYGHSHIRYIAAYSTKTDCLPSTMRTI